MITISKVGLERGDKQIFNDLNLIIYDGERIGIIGDNGSGKTSLLKLIVGEIKPDSGIVESDNIFGYVKQASEFKAEEIIAELADADFSKEFFKHLKKLGLEEFEMSNERIKMLSCGEQTKMSLAFAFANNPSVLILDEPTNHLDAEGREILIDNVNGFAGTVISVSHDVEFLNRTISKIIEIGDCKAREFYGDYTEYRQQIEKEKISQENIYNKHIKKVKKLNEDINRLKSWAQSADSKVGKQGGSPSDAKLISLKSNAEAGARKISSAAKNKMSQLEAEQSKNIAQPEKDNKIRYRLIKEDLKSKIAIEAVDVSKSFGDELLFENVNFVINGGDKVLLKGGNGSGKSTLISLIMGECQPTSGYIRKTPSLKIGLMRQDVYDLPQEDTILDVAKSQDSEYRTIFLTNLVNMNIDKTRFNTKIKNLSLGEQMRVKLSNLILSDANMLIVDEPTNHLDIANKEYLKKVLQEYKGTILLVSHDKDFVDGICDVEFEIKDKTLKK